jgi:hypothetical protein
MSAWFGFENCAFDRGASRNKYVSVRNYIGCDGRMKRVIDVRRL